MKKGLFGLAATAVLVGSIALSGCTWSTQNSHHRGSNVRLRVDNNYYDNHRPLFVVCYQTPRHACQHASCYERRLNEMYERHRNQEDHKFKEQDHRDRRDYWSGRDTRDHRGHEDGRGSAFQYQRQESAFPEGRKAMRRGELRLNIPKFKTSPQDLKKPTTEKKQKFKQGDGEKKSKFKTGGP